MGSVTQRAVRSRAWRDDWLSGRAAGAGRVEGDLLERLASAGLPAPS